MIGIVRTPQPSLLRRPVTVAELHPSSTVDWLFLSPYYPHSTIGPVKPICLQESRRARVSRRRRLHRHSDPRRHSDQHRHPERRRGICDCASPSLHGSRSAATHRFLLRRNDRGCPGMTMEEPRTECVHCSRSWSPCGPPGAHHNEGPWRDTSFLSAGSATVRLKDHTNAGQLVGSRGGCP
jgi:hypothetical protein